MSELEKAIADRVQNNADLEGAQELVDAHIDAISGGLIHERTIFIQFDRYVE